MHSVNESVSYDLVLRITIPMLVSLFCLLNYIHIISVFALVPIRIVHEKEVKRIVQTLITDTSPRIGKRTSSIFYWLSLEWLDIDQVLHIERSIVTTLTMNKIPKLELNLYSYSLWLDYTYSLMIARIIYMPIKTGLVVLERWI